MKDKYILDSCVWIDLERRNQTVAKIVEPLLQSNQVCLVDLIVAEVLRGVKTKSDFENLNEVFSSFNILSTDWISVAQFAFHVRKAGFSPPLTDLYISHCAIQNNKTLISSDSDFYDIAKVTGLKFVECG